VFFGTGPVAAESLVRLSAWADVEAVITKPKPSYHKGSFPVLDVAERLGLRVLPVSDKPSLDELIATKPVQSRLAVLIDFGIIVSQAVIDYFTLGIINSHFSLLPEWRGADPITFSILSGQAQTGVSLMRLVEKMDEGPLIGVGVQELDNTITTPILTAKLIDLSDSLLQHDLPRLLKGEALGVDQQQMSKLIDNYPAEPTYSRKLSKEDGILDWQKPAEQLEREVRAYAEWPKSRTAIAGKDVVITQAHVIGGKGDAGKIWKDGKSFGFYTANGIFVIDSLKPAGKGEMPAAAFLAGYQI